MEFLVFMYSNETLGSMKGRKFMNQLNDHQLFKKD
jgi:hypothetical protein